VVEVVVMTQRKTIQATEDLIVGWESNTEEPYLWITAESGTDEEQQVIIYLSEYHPLRDALDEAATQLAAQVAREMEEAHEPDKL
jgi:hypothetical protein